MVQVLGPTKSTLSRTSRYFQRKQVLPFHAKLRVGEKIVGKGIKRFYWFWVEYRGLLFEAERD